ncbi:hypothetical protein GS416_10795 [Rhodococcus hoagii]|nr:hypothetical protein [Prescottella equi]
MASADGRQVSELGSLGRTFTVGVRQGQLWLGETPCGVEACRTAVVIESASGDAMINHLDGHNPAGRLPDSHSHSPARHQLVLEQDGRELGIQITRELAEQIVALLDDPKDD